MPPNRRREDVGRSSRRWRSLASASRGCSMNSRSLPKRAGWCWRRSRSRTARPAYLPVIDLLWKSGRRSIRPRIGREIRQLIRQMSIENPLWGAPNSRRAAHARYRGRRTNRGEVHDQEAGATFRGLEDISAQSYRWDRFNRPVCGSYDLLQAALWPGHSSSRQQAIGEHKRDAQSDRRVGCGSSK